MTFDPTHVVPQGGVPAWASPDGSVPPSANLAAGTEVEAGEERGEWLHVTADNGWTGWVDGSRLVPKTALAGVAPGEAPPPGTSTDAVLLAGVSYPLASIGRRLGARLVDGAILFVAFFIVVLPIAALTLDDDEDVDLGDVVVTLVGITISGPYEVLFVALRGATPGKRLLKIRVASIHTAGHPDLGQAAKRWALPGLLGLVPVVGGLAGLVVYLSATWSPQRRGWHDRFADTVVVKTAS